MTAPKSSQRKIPAAPAWFVAAIEIACLGCIPLPGWALIGATVLVDQQSPIEASVAIASDAGFWVGANNGTISGLPLGQPAQAGAIPASTRLSLGHGWWRWLWLWLWLCLRLAIV